MKEKISQKKREIILITAILLVACTFYLGNQFRHREPAAIVEVSVDGSIVERLDLSKDTEITIQGANQGTNHLVIKDGQAYISEATCPDGICVHQGKISSTGEMVVCLPNLMIAQIVGEEKN